MEQVDNPELGRRAPRIRLARAGVIAKLMMKERWPAFRTIEGWARLVLLETGAICECAEHGWAQDLADPHAREHALQIAREDTKKTLRVTLPTRVSLERGVRIIIDQGQAIERPYVNCFASGCMADYDAGAELVDQLKQGRMLVLEAIDKANSPISLTVPLVDFANAYDGPSHETKVFEEVVSAEEMQASSDREKRAEEERKTLCEAR
jgi:Invasion associated locus B (IalB) protein